MSNDKLATLKGKEYALEQLRKRREENEKKEKINNASLPAGSSMYFYCKACDAVEVKSEGYVTPPKPLCEECQALKELDWLE